MQKVTPRQPGADGYPMGGTAGPTPGPGDALNDPPARRNSSSECTLRVLSHHLRREMKSPHLVDFS